MAGPRPSLVLAAALAASATIAACSGSSEPQETAPPRTPLPVLRTASPPSLEPSESPEGPLPSTPDPESAFQQLLAAVPDPIERRCEQGTTGRRELARADCRPTSGATTVRYALFSGEEDLAAALDALRDRLPAGATDGPGCGRGAGTERLPVGRRLCYGTDGGAASVTWTNELVYVLATATRDDGDFGRLETFWRNAGPVTP